ncbi:hypothetical protein OZL92_09505 [Bacillus sonorensis]|uniref:Uncharacterized protein n=1 Tax=Bacillus sonorensis L12 TaxID=1274524 RepID=M5PBQ3_9BACI|nr:MULTISPECIES: hypothetical protein [Bacillus]TWK79456.1 hypothetical protein CHCC20335_0233 [Bacillus paralicheniformis]EME73180.1 hypothetical protein BSONL12_15689 [Bacillus sonorensis L12]MCZ0073004.1 hypothetical protein [Bacillus sonorensis]MCZ0091625.1 hypothetical protein [Bacillus sonorensis]MDI3410836.1 hypothetical protein [Bacillus sonorensis]
MKNRKVLIWTVSAVVYVGLVIGVYSIFSGQNSTPDEQHPSHQSE